MSTFQLVWYELKHRWVPFLLAVGVVAVAAAYAVVSVAWMHRQVVEQQQRVAGLDDEIRKITKDLGFNISILPKDQNLAQFYAQDFARKTMPYEYVTRLAESRDIVTINHLRPALIGKLFWEEKNRQVILMGVTGVVPWAHRSNPKEPLSEPVEAGTIHVGAILARETGLAQGDSISINGSVMKVDQVYPPRGNNDDITLWTDLSWAQQQLQLPGQINLIQALECNCASIDRLAEIDQDITRVLGGDVQVHELSSIAIARAKARVEVEQAGQASLAALRSWSTATVVGLTLAAALTISFLAALNVRQRREEIGILRALGAPTTKIMFLFLAKAVLIGFAGAAVGLMAGSIIVRGPLGGTLLAADATQGSPLLVGLVGLIVAPLTSMLASWLPTLIAASQDPALVLRNE